MVRPGDEDEFVLVERAAADARVAELADDAEFDLAASNEVHDLLRVPGPDSQANVRVSLDEANQNFRQDVSTDRGSDRERELTDDAVFQFPDKRTAAPDRLDRAVRVGEEGAASRGQDHPRVRPPEECGGELRFERLEPGGERRLADREGIRCAPHVSQSRDLDETFDLGEEHGTASGHW